MGSCKSWIQKIDLVNHSPKPPPNQNPLDATTRTSPSPVPPTLILPETCRSRAACTCNTDGKCVGMVTSHSFDVLYKAFHKAKALGLHNSIYPPPKSFASELMGLLARKTKSENKYQSKNISKTHSHKRFRLIF
eukprot:1153608-Pelagomonas_calceolata.AAC.1